MGSARQFWRFNWRFGLRNVIAGLDYVRCLEYPLVFDQLDVAYGGQLLDVGTGRSIFALFVAVNTPLRVVALDRGDWVHWQHEMATKVMRSREVNRRFTVLVGDARALCFRDDRFDCISAISTIEHIEKDGDSEAMMELARVLKPGGRLVLTVPFNYECYKDFWILGDTYTSVYKGTPLFYQRHYDDEALGKRLIEPSGLTVVKKAIFGEPNVRCFNRLFANPHVPLAVKAFYLWLTPLLAGRFLRVVRDSEIKTKANLPMITCEGALLVLEKRN